MLNQIKKLRSDLLLFLKSEGKEDSFIILNEKEYAYFFMERQLFHIRNSFVKIFPEIPITNTIPEKREASATGYSHSKVLLISLAATKKEREFLQRMERAISSQLAAATLIDGKELEHDERGKQLLSASHLKLIILPSGWEESFLAKWCTFSEGSELGSRFLGNTPILFMEQIEKYLTDVELKRKLWKRLCSLLSSST